MDRGKKRIFALGLAFLLSVIAVVMISLYDNVNKNPVTEKQQVPTQLSRTMLYFMMDQARIVNPEYSVISFGKDVPDSIKSEIEYILEENMLEARELLEKNPNFQYSVVNTVTGQKTESSSIDAFQEEANVYSTFTYDANGSLQSSGDYISTDFTYISAYQLLRQYISIYLNTAEDIYSIKGIDIPREQLKMNVPTNLKVTYCIPKEIVDHNDNISVLYLHDWEYAQGFLLLVFCSMAVLIGIYMIVFPVKIEQEVNPFAFMRKVKVEVKWLFLVTAIAMAYIGAVVLSGYTIIGDTRQVLDTMGIPYAGQVAAVANFAMLFITGLLTAMGWFELKYMLTSGFVRYLKEDTLIGGFCRWVKKYFDKLSEIDLSSNLDKTIMKYVLVNVAVIVVLVCFWGFGIFLAVIYGLISFFYIKEKARKYKQDYNVLLDATHELAEGNFDGEIQEDVGIFNGLRDEFKNIKKGFQKAVSEEIKSQNMKTELISNVSHDLKTPLTGIKNYVELLEADDVDEETKKQYLKTLNHYTDRLSSLIEDLFEVSKVNSGNIQLNPVELNIVALVEQAQAEAEDILRERNLTVYVNAENTSIILNLDGDKTYRIFENLFTNIVKYALPNTRVYVDIVEEAAYVKITFKNISEAQMNFHPDEIVERFVRGDKSRHEKGSGLGLAIVKSFTEIQNGEFCIEIDGDLFKAVVKFYK